MRWYSSYIDQNIPLDTRQRRKLHKRAWSRWYKSPANCTIYGVGLALSLAIFMFLPDVVESVFGYDTWPVRIGSLGVYLTLIGILYLIMRHIRFAPCVFRELRDEGFDVCMRCGYWLRDLDESIMRCPECGQVRADRSEEKRDS
jgi:predicted RNA-binding Zn-ribbon protein involved in translation (DUF1610 family)